MVKINVILDDTFYSLNYKGYAKTVEVNTFDLFSGLAFFEEGVSLITPDWFNDFHRSFFLELRSSLSIVDKIKLRIFGTTITVYIKEKSLKDDLILRTLFGVFEHLIWARVVRIYYNEMRINNAKFECEIQFLAKKYSKTKNENFRIRSKFYNTDNYYTSNKR